MKSQANIAAKLERLGDALLDTALAKKARGEEKPMETREKVDIFKSVSAWHLGVMKAKTKMEDDGDGGSFEALRDRLNGGNDKEQMQ